MSKFCKMICHSIWTGHRHQQLEMNIIKITYVQVGSYGPLSVSHWHKCETETQVKLNSHSSLARDAIRVTTNPAIIAHHTVEFDLSFSVVRASVGARVRVGLGLAGPKWLESG